MYFLNYRASTDNTLSLGDGISRIGREYHDRNHQDDVGEIVYVEREMKTDRSWGEMEVVKGS
jgi:hypothetical protein